MFTMVKCESDIFAAVTHMLDELGEPHQALTSDSPRPLVVHHVMGQMTLVVDGAGWAHLAGHIVNLAPGDLIILAPGCEHSFAANSEGLRLRHWHWPQAMLHQDRIVLQDHTDFTPEAASWNVAGRDAC